jgi:hypothetical protein
MGNVTVCGWGTKMLELASAATSLNFKEARIESDVVTVTTMLEILAS